ncbi:GPI-anchored surface protein, putative, partial [Bodo saltans]
MSAAMSLLADGYSAGSVILGVVGAAAVLGFTVHLVVVVVVQDVVRRQFTSIPATLHGTRRRRGDSAAATLTNFIAWLTVPTEQWRRQRLRGSGVEVRANQVAQRYGVVFTTYRHDCLWFAAVDLGMGVLCGAIAGGAQVDSDPCSAVILSGWLLAAISFLFVPAVLYFRPYACRQDAGLGIVSAAITVISSVGAATNAIDNNSNFALSLLCIALQLLPLIMTLVRVPVARCTGA